MTPGVNAKVSDHSRRLLSGRDRWKSPLMLIACTVFCTSSIGVSPVTWIVSATDPSCIATSTSMFSSARTSRPVRSNFENPASSATSVYVPGGRFSNR